MIGIDDRPRPLPAGLRLTAEEIKEIDSAIMEQVAKLRQYHLPGQHEQEDHGRGRQGLLKSLRLKGRKALRKIVGSPEFYDIMSRAAALAQTPTSELRLAMDALAQMAGLPSLKLNAAKRRSKKKYATATKAWAEAKTRYVERRLAELAQQHEPAQVTKQLRPRLYHLAGQHDQCDHSPTGDCVDPAWEKAKKERTRSTRTLRYDPAAKRWSDPDGGELPKQIAKIRIPPAWKDVRYNPDPEAKLLVTGRDVKGRRQAIYSEAFTAQRAQQKFQRVKDLDTQFARVETEIAKDLKAGQSVEEASALRLIMATGIRPGSDGDTKAAKQAYGATTLLGQHVVRDGNSVRLRFTGKKGVANDILVSDRTVATDLLRRKAKAGDGGRLFKTDSGRLLGYTKSRDGGKFKTKDFRTLLATREATAAVSRAPKPKTEKEYKKAVRTVAKTVAAKLGNTPAVALASYIHPSVFAEWRNGL